MSEWDGTSWEGVAVLPRPPRDIPPPQGMATVAGKAAFGAGVAVYDTGVPLSVFTKNPRRLMREAQAAYRSSTWVHVAERAVTRKVAGLPWHLEDASDDAIDDEHGTPQAQAIRTLFEQPQAKLDARERQPGIGTWRGLISVTSRHMGLCNLAHWYLDGRDADGLPNAILYINPARMTPDEDGRGRLLRWLLDADQDGRNGTPLALEEVLTFYLDPPDSGHLGAGLYEAAALKAGVSVRADQHANYVLGSGGRLPGIISPKDGYITNDDQYADLVGSMRNVNEAPDAAKRTTILRGPVDFTATGGNPGELGLIDISKLTREDILSVWGVPQSQAPVSVPVGLNSGETKGYDEAVLMQGAVHDRVVAIREVLQYQLADKAGLELVIEEPEFDDETPAYERAAKTTNLALTRNERRAILGLDPLPDFDELTGDPLGVAIDLPGLLTVVGAGPSDEKRPQINVTPVPQLEPGPIAPVADMQPLQMMAGKASLGQARERLLARFEPTIRKAVASFLGEQRTAIAAALRAKADHLARKGPKDQAAWWDGPRWDRALTAALRGHVTGLATSTVALVEDRLSAGKADFDDEVAQAVLDAVGQRVTDINATTREAIAEAVATGFADGLSISEIAASLDTLPAFDAVRAELVARTETAFTYNRAAVASYRALDVERVEVIDGDQDEICAAAHGQIWTLDEALADPLGHPNCVRDFAPVVGKATASTYVKVPDAAVNTDSRITVYRMEYDDVGQLIGVREEQA